MSKSFKEFSLTKYSFLWSRKGNEKGTKLTLPHWKPGKYIIVGAVGMNSFVGTNEEGFADLYEKHPYPWELYK